MRELASGLRWGGVGGDFGGFAVVCWVGFSRLVVV